MDPGQVCLGAVVLGECVGWAIQQYILWGFFFFVAGIVIASFIPFPAAKKMGLVITIIGMVIMVALPYIILLWLNSIGFQIAVYSALVFIIIMMILFPKGKDAVEG